MKQYLFLFILIFAFQWGYSQDIIVTTDKDTIECKITRIADEFIHFSVLDKSGNLLMRSRLPLSKISYYDQGEPADQSESGEEESSTPTTGLPEGSRFILEEFDPASFRLALNAGYTYQLGGYKGLPDSYKKQVQSLWNLGTELHYFPSENFGIGARYNHIRTKANEDFEPPISTAFGFSSLRDERIRFSYLALSILYRNFIYDDQVVHYFISGGLINYRTDGYGDGVPFYQEGETIGIALGVSYDFILIKNFGVGLGGEVNIARLSEFDNNGVVVPADFSLTRLDFTIGIRLFQ